MLVPLSGQPTSRKLQSLSCIALQQKTAAESITLIQSSSMGSPLEQLQRLHARDSEPSVSSDPLDSSIKLKNRHPS